MERQQLLVQVVPNNLVERAERLVHQQQVRVERERARNRGPLLHAARKLPGEHAAEVAETYKLQNARDPLSPLPGRVAHDLERQAHILLDGAPGVEPGRLEHITVGPLQPRLSRRHPVDGDRAARRLLQVRNHPQQCRLSAARRPDEADEFAGRHIEVDVRERMHGTVVGLKDQIERGGGYRTCLMHGRAPPGSSETFWQGGSAPGRAQTPLGMFNGLR